MKTVNNFLDKASLFKVWLVIYPISILFISGLVYGLDYLSGESTFTNDFNYLKFGALMGMVFSWMFILMISMSRKSQKFWDYSKEVLALINAAETKDELGSIYKGEFQSLIELAQGGPHQTELKRQYAIMQTKYKYSK